MGQIEERKLLYYDCFQRIAKHFYGEPIYHFTCRDVKTGEEVILGTCLYASELEQTVGGHYYANITEATSDFDMLWDLSDSGISPVADTFEEVQEEYQRMLSQGVSQEEINSAMITSFKKKNHIRNL